MDKSIYNKEFHNNRDSITRHSAEIITNIMLRFFPNINTVCDVGGGNWSMA